MHVVLKDIITVQEPGGTTSKNVVAKQRAESTVRKSSITVRSGDVIVTITKTIEPEVVVNSPALSTSTCTETTNTKTINESHVKENTKKTTTTKIFAKTPRPSKTTVTTQTNTTTTTMAKPKPQVL